MLRLVTAKMLSLITPSSLEQTLFNSSRSLSSLKQPDLLIPNRSLLPPETPLRLRHPLWHFNQYQRLHTSSFSRSPFSAQDYSNEYIPPNSDHQRGLMFKQYGNTIEEIL